MAKRGIDISAHNGDINLSALKNQIDFVIIRVGYGVSGSIDKKFKRNADLCEQLGIPYGFYWYSYALDVNGAANEAKHFLKAIKPYNPTYGVWFDMEDADGYKRKKGMPSNNTLKEMCYTFCETTENAGYYSGIYASLSWFNNELSGSRLNRFTKWVAQWPTSGGKQKGLSVDPNSHSDRALWQFTSEGKFSGYSGVLDTNYAYRTFPNPGKPNPEPKPQPAPSPAPSGNILDLVAGVMQGQYGDGEKRKEALGSRYDEVQSVINHIFSASVDTLANEVINGKYGDGDIRKRVLGERYNEVQNKVNQKLSGGSSGNSGNIKKGDTIIFRGTKTYSGINLASWTYNHKFKVIEVSGDRVVISNNGIVIAAVNKQYCKKV